MAFWLIGSGFSGIGNAFIGYENFIFLKDFTAKNLHQIIGGLYCCTIASAGGQEFVNFEVEPLLAFSILAFIYPIPLHWFWDEIGWLQIENSDFTRDFAGAGIVHLTGGCVAFALVLLSKPRPGRFPILGLRNTKWSRRASNIGLSSINDLHNFATSLKSGSDATLAGLGAFLNLIGILAFINYEKDVLFVCFLSMSGGILTSGALSKIFTKQWSLYRLRGGALIGLVTISSSANQLAHYAAFLIGCLAGKLALI